MKNPSNTTLPLDTRFKVRKIEVGGKLVEYVSRYTQASFRYLEESEVTCMYPNTCNTSLFKFQRDQMPQINQEALLKSMFDKGIHVEQFQQKPSTLSPMQAEFNEQKVHDIIKNNDSNEQSPIVTSRDQFIIDGHHRWLAHYNMGDMPIKVMQINLNAQTILDSLSGKSIESYKSINEELVSVLKESEPARIAVAMMCEAIDNGTEISTAIKEAADTCQIDEDDARSLIEAVILAEAKAQPSARAKKKSEAKKSNKITVEHPITSLRRISKTNLDGHVTFKNGAHKKVNVETAKHIMHIHQNMSDANKKRIESMIARGDAHFTEIAKWAKYHGKGMLKESEEDCSTIDCISAGDHSGKKVKLIADEKHCIIESSSRCGNYHTIANEGDMDHGVVHRSKLKFVDEDQMNIDGGGAQKPILVNPSATITQAGAIGSYR